MEEIWKEVVGYEKRFRVSNIGRVWSFYRKYMRGGVIMVPNIRYDGYQQVCMWQNGNSKSLKIHRLVAIAFIPNPENKREVNHINGIRTDNRVENLEWATHSENIRHSLKYLDRKYMKKPVIQYDLHGKFIAIHDSLSEAAIAVNGSKANLSKVCQNKKNQAKGFKFKFL